MKKIIFILLACLVSTNCDKDNTTSLDKAVPDPDDTASYTLVGTSWNQGGALDYLSWISLNNMNLEAPLSILTVGKVNGLGNITNIPPEKVWTNKAAAISNYGYIVKTSEDTYIRVFVSDWKEQREIAYNGSTYTKYYCTIKYAALNP